MTDARDEAYMRRALALAERGWGQTAPNPMVGAVLVRDDMVVGEGWHERYGEAHAEVNALRAAAARAQGATMYVTLEPCNHWGKTPPCVDAIVAAGVRRVVVATLDPGAEAGGGTARLRESGIEVATGLCDREARELNAPFFNAFTSDRPWITLKLALSIDGAIADFERAKGWLTNEQSLAAVHRLRANSDAVAVGSGTFKADAPSLTVRGDITPRIAPLRVVFDTRGDAAALRTIVRDDQPETLVVDASDIVSAVRALRAQGVLSLLVEGGARVSSLLLDAELIDRLVIFQAPIVLGGGALHAFSHATARHVQGARRLPVIRRETFGDDLMTIYALHAV